MIDGGRMRRLGATVAAVAALALAGCGGDAGVSISDPNRCAGGEGQQVRGVVQMPNGRVAFAPTLWQRVAALAAAPAEALSGGIALVGRGVTVQLVHLRPDNVANPDVIVSTTTNGRGEFCVALPEGADENTCRYAVQVGRANNGSLTRALVFSTGGEPIDIDYRSEATLRVILAQVSPAALCEYEPDEIRDVYGAVLDAPGTVTGANASQVNALAASLAEADQGVQEALVAGADPAPTAPPTGTSGPSTITPTGPRPSATATQRAQTRSPTVAGQPTRSGRATRTPLRATATRTQTRRPATRTPTGVTSATVVATNTVRPTGSAVPATATRPPATNTVRPTATRTIGSGPSATPTPTATPSGPPLGQRRFTIREDSQYPAAPPNEPRSAYFTSSVGGFSGSDRFGPGTLVLEAGAQNANGQASLRLAQDAYFKINVPPNNATLCVKLFAAGSSGSIDCNGGTPYGVDLVEGSGDVPPSSPVTGRGNDSGAGAAQLNVMQAIAEVGNMCNEGTGRCTTSATSCTRDDQCLNNFATSLPCDATTTFPAPVSVVYTTANFLARKGAVQVSRAGENFNCAAWTTAEGDGVLVSGVVDFDDRLGGNVANLIRIADK